MADVLVISPHPDDAEIGCGGLMARLVSQGRQVVLADLTRGEMGSRGTPDERAREAEAAARELGLAGRENLDLGDSRLEAGHDQALEVVRLVRRHRPRLLLGPWLSDLHPDHAAGGQLVKKAWYLSGLHRLLPDLPAHRPAHLVHFFCHETVPPSFIVDVSDYYEVKRRAIRCFASQLHDPDRAEPDTMISDASFLERIELRDRNWGNLIGASHGEAFVQQNPPRVDDVLELLSDS